jgi:hypothetical protein
MSIATIEKYIEQKNAFRKILGKRPLSLLNAEDRQTIADDIDMSLSPENLTCDGELSRGQINAKYRMLTRAAQELLSIDPTVKFYEFN